MRLNAIQTLIILLAITVGTVITRFLPPILFPHGKPLPKFLHFFARCYCSRTRAQ